MTERTINIVARVIAALFLLSGLVFLVCKLTGYDPIIVP